VFYAYKKVMRRILAFGIFLIVLINCTCQNNSMVTLDSMKNALIGAGYEVNGDMEDLLMKKSQTLDGFT